MANSRHVLLERLGHSSKELALSARTARPKENENHFYFTLISICSATHLISISLSLVNFCLVPKLETERVIKLAFVMKYFPINQVCLVRSVDWQRSRRDSLWSAQKNMKGKREKNTSLTLAQQPP
jgi:hypothetical protein